MTRSRTTVGGPLIIIHSSDEWYGADRMVAELAVIAGESLAGVEVWLPDGGPARTPSLSQELAKRGIASRSLPLPVIRRRSLSAAGVLTLLRQTRDLRGLLAQANPSAVVAATTAVVPALWAAPRSSWKLLYVQEIWKSWERIVLGILGGPANRLLAISDPVAEALPPRLRRRTTVVTNAVADSDLPPAPMPAGPLTFVVASRWNSWKGHAFLLQAWDAAGCPGRLIVLGGAPDAGVGVDVPGIVAGLSRPDTVEIVGEVADIRAWLDGAHVLILPSMNPEPFGLVVIEAFARARPVIATDHGAPASVVKSEVGWLVAPGDVQQFADVLAGVTLDEAARRGESARGVFVRDYSIEAWRKEVKALLRSSWGAKALNRTH